MNFISWAEISPAPGMWPGSRPRCWEAYAEASRKADAGSDDAGSDHAAVRAEIDI